jgi:DNA-binding MarR family transcriptional regulator
MTRGIEEAGRRLGAAVQDYQAAVDDFDREIARLLGVNETDLRCLEVLLSVEETTPGALGSRLGLTTGSVTAMLDRLERLDYLARNRHPVDRRSTLVRITPLARERAYGLMAPFLEDSVGQVVARYSAEQMELVTDFLAFSGRIQNEHTRRLREVASPPKRGKADKSPSA